MQTRIPFQRDWIFLVKVSATLLKTLSGFTFFAFSVGNDCQMIQNKKILRRRKKVLKKFMEHRVKCVLWSDEKIFTIEKAHNHQNVFQLFSYKCSEIIEKQKPPHDCFFTEGLMLWAGVTDTEKFRNYFFTDFLL